MSMGVLLLGVALFCVFAAPTVAEKPSIMFILSVSWPCRRSATHALVIPAHCDWRMSDWSNLAPPWFAV